MKTDKRILCALIATIGGCCLGSGLAQAQSVDLLPLLDVTRGGSETSANALGASHRSPVGGYVRFWVERRSNASPAAQRIYSVERRTWLERFFIGRSHTRLLTARLVVNRPHVITQTVTLAAASHDSNRRQGESWSSELGDRRFLTPYFRVDQGITASVEVALSASVTVDSDITRNILAVVERGARLVSPSGPLVTSLTSPQMTQSADFVDSSISRLFGQAIAERSQSDFAAEVWDDGTVEPLATITAIFPMGRQLWSGVDMRDVGEWDVRVSAPIVSIFSAVPLHGPEEGADTPGGEVDRCSNEPGKDNAPNVPLTGHDRQACLAFSGLVPSRVLGLSVGDNITLGQALRGDSGIIAALQRFDGATNKGWVAREACVLVTERAEALGLNAYDSAAALWAFASNGGFSANVSLEVWRSDCAAVDLARRIHLSLNTSSTDQPHPEPDPNPGPEANGATAVSEPEVGDRR